MIHNGDIILLLLFVCCFINQISHHREISMSCSATQNNNHNKYDIDDIDNTHIINNDDNNTITIIIMIIIILIITIITTLKILFLVQLYNDDTRMNNGACFIRSNHVSNLRASSNAWLSVLLLSVPAQIIQRRLENYSTHPNNFAANHVFR